MFAPVLPGWIQAVAGLARPSTLAVVGFLRLLRSSAAGKARALAVLALFVGGAMSWAVLAGRQASFFPVFWPGCCRCGGMLPGIGVEVLAQAIQRRCHRADRLMPAGAAAGVVVAVAALTARPRNRVRERPLAAIRDVAGVLSRLTDGPEPSRGGVMAVGYGLGGDAVMFHQSKIVPLAQVLDAAQPQRSMKRDELELRRLLDLADEQDLTLYVFFCQETFDRQAHPAGFRYFDQPFHFQTVGLFPAREPAWSDRLLRYVGR